MFVSHPCHNRGFLQERRRRGEQFVWPDAFYSHLNNLRSVLPSSLPDWPELALTEFLAQGDSKIILISGGSRSATYFSRGITWWSSSSRWAPELEFFRSRLSPRLKAFFTFPNSPLGYIFVYSFRRRFCSGRLIPEIVLLFLIKE